MSESTTGKETESRPYVICHMLASLDGKIDGSFFAAPESGPAIAEYGNIRNAYGCKSVVYGTITMMGGYSEGLAGNLPQTEEHYPKEDYVASSDVENYIVSVDPKGVLGWNSKYIEKKGRPRAHVIEVLTEAVAEEYLAYLRRYDICGLWLRYLAKR